MENRIGAGDYRPDILALTISRQCNIQCAHCIVESGPKETKKMDSDTISRMIEEAFVVGIRDVAIYGGEPFLQIKGLLPETIKKSLDFGMNVSIGTNGFWGKTKSQANEFLGKIEDVAEWSDKKVHIGLSFDKFHQEFIPPQSLANIITSFKKGNFPHISLGFQTFSDDFGSIFDQIHEECLKEGIVLVQSNSHRYCYPADVSELLTFDSDYKSICNHLDIPETSTQEEIKDKLRDFLTQEKYFHGPSQFIGRIFDIGKGVQTYLIFPKEDDLINFISEEKPLNAGRARDPNKPLELRMRDDGPHNCLVISPTGKAYAYPAQMTSEEGVSVEDKTILRIIYEVSATLPKTRQVNY
jgi:organic radical activating enzyme